MRYSLRLIAERLHGRGFRVLAMNDRDVFVRRARLLTDPEQALEADTLYVCADETPDIIGKAEVEPSSSFAFANMPERSWRIPSLVFGSATNQVNSTSQANPTNPTTPTNPAALLNAITDVIDELNDAFAHMNELAWQPGGLGDIVEAFSQLVGNSVYIVDSSFKVVAITNDPDLEEMSVNWMNAAQRGYLSYDVIANLIRSNELHNIESSRVATIVNSEFFYVPFANYNLRQAGKVLGHLFVVQMYKTITPCDLELIDAVAPIVLRALQADPSYQVRRGPLYEHFVIDWLTGGLQDSAYIRSQLDALAFNADELSVVAIFRLPVNGEFRREHLARLLEDRQGCRAVSHEDQVIALFQLKRHKEKAAVLRKVKTICQNQQCHAAVSDVQDSFLNTPRAYRQACEALRISDAMGLEDDMVIYGNVAAYQPFLNFSTIEELDAFCHPAAITLREHDRTHALQLLPTLSAFLKNDRDTLAAAEALYVHRNTLTYRMKRILELCPVDLDDFNVRHRLLESVLVLEHYDALAAHLS